ncbi:hypothetical protein N0V88_005728 [Collariella sp. IMI 366227]|nr:hypothetical protein N0V88_005728 [Collariella sp. IMI 366227]
MVDKLWANMLALIVQNPNRHNQQRIGISNICRSRSMSENCKFSAADYLPFSKSTRSEGGNEKDVDWDSIMIYSSGASGIGEASPGNDQRAPIFFKPNGDQIPINLTLNQVDISGMHKLYGKKLLQKAGGTVTSSFRIVFSLKLREEISE